MTWNIRKHASIYLLCITTMLPLLFFSQKIGASETNSSVLKGKTIEVCFATVPGIYQIKDGKASGFLVEVTESVLGEGGMKARFHEAPLKRCFHRLRKGKSHLMPVLPPSLIREFFLDFTIPWTRAKSVYFYLKEKEKDTLELEDPEDLFRLGKICGISGSSHEFLDLDHDDLDLDATNIKAIVKKLKKKRCGSFVTRWILVQALILDGDYNILDDQDLLHKDIPGVDAQQFAMAISEELDFSEELIEHLNAHLKKYNSFETAKSLADKYLKGAKVIEQKWEDKDYIKFHNDYQKSKPKEK